MGGGVTVDREGVCPLTTPVSENTVPHPPHMYNYMTTYCAIGGIYLLNRSPLTVFSSTVCVECLDINGGALFFFLDTTTELLREVGHSLPQKVSHSLPQKFGHSLPQKVGHSLPQKVGHPLSQKVGHSLPQKG